MMSALLPQSPIGWQNEAFSNEQNYPDAVVVPGEKTLRKLNESEVCVLAVSSILNGILLYTTPKKRQTNLPNIVTAF